MAASPITIVVWICILISKTVNCQSHLDFIDNSDDNKNKSFLNSGVDETTVQLSNSDVVHNTEVTINLIPRQDGDNKELCLTLCRENNNDMLEEVDQNCMNSCMSKKKEKIYEPRLVCRSNETLVLAWSNGQFLKPFSREIYYRLNLFKEQCTNDSDADGKMTIVTSKVTNVTMLEFTNLTASCRYILRVQTFNENGQVGLPAISRGIWTLASNTVPHPPINITHGEIVYNKEKKTFETNLSWIPDEEMTCSYLGFVQTHHEVLTQIEVQIPDNMFSIKLIDMRYSLNYTVFMRAVHNDLESPKAWMSFVTPSCLDVHHSLNECPPPTPTNFTTTDEKSYFLSGQWLCDVTLRWDAPQYAPDYYIVNISSSGVARSANVSGIETSVQFKNMNIITNYAANIVAISPAGISQPSNLVKPYVLSATQGTTRNSLYRDWATTVIWIVLGSLLFLIIAILAGLLIHHRHKKMKLYKRRCRYFEELDKKDPRETDTGTSFTAPHEDDAFEVIPDNIVLYEVLGEGAFGVVRRGWLPHINREVAVKMLKDEPSAEEVKQFRQEMDMMKSVGSHAHIVSLVGCCTRPSSTMMLVVEFCAKGDLRNYLRWIWEIMTSRKPSNPLCPSDLNLNTSVEGTQIKYAELVSSENSEDVDQMPTSPNLIVNRLYELEDVIKENEESKKNTDITATDLISFGRQIAMGMEFLSSNRVVHRDLAARNVLVCADKTVKIADFGLSRDIYQENMYRKTGSGKLPIKWMAIESLTHQIYTTQSDVWSFGILLWEIVTLGATPYPSVPSGALTKLLHSGYRMERPSNCSQDIYRLMLACWQTRPRDRPSFTDIRQHLDVLLDNMCSHSYLNLETTNGKDNMANELSPQRLTNSEQPKYIDSMQSEKTVTDSERYVKPISTTPTDKTKKAVTLQTMPNIYISGPQASHNGYCNDQTSQPSSLINIDNTTNDPSILDGPNSHSIDPVPLIINVGNMNKSPTSLNNKNNMNNEDQIISILDGPNIDDIDQEPPLIINNGVLINNGKTPATCKQHATHNNNLFNENKSVVLLATNAFQSCKDNKMVMIPNKNGSIEMNSIIVTKPICSNSSNCKVTQSPLICKATH